MRLHTDLLAIIDYYSRMLKNLMILLSLWGSLSVFAQDASAVIRPECAVLEFQTSPGDSLQGLSGSEALRQRIFLAGRVRLVARNQMDMILQEQGFQQSGCTSSECEVQTGRLLGVSQIITGSLVRTGTDRWDIRASRLDVESGAVLGMGHWSTDGDFFENLDAGAQSLERQLWTRPQTASPPVAEELPVSNTASDTLVSDSSRHWPIGFALLYPVQFPFKETPVHGLAISALYGSFGAVHGLHTGFVLRSASQHGLAAGAVSLVDGNTVGIQVGAFYTRSRQLRGMQVGISNQADQVKGFQIGLVNSCGSLQGVQIGLANHVRGRTGAGAWMPIMNVGF